MNILKMKSQALCKLISGGFNPGFQKPNMKESWLGKASIRWGKTVADQGTDKAILGEGFAIKLKV